MVCFMFNKVLLGNLSTETTEQEVIDLFAGTDGTIVSVDLPRDPKTGTGRGYAFVVMTNEEQAVKAVADLNGKRLSDRTVSITLTEQLKDQAAKPKSQWYKFGMV